MVDPEANRDYNRRAKLEAIGDYFDKLEERLTFLAELMGKGKKDEAYLLCVCYIDSLASDLHWPEQSSSKNFVRALIEHGGQALFSYIHPVQLRRGLAA